nr:YciI family protein [Marinobacter halodurans]
MRQETLDYVARLERNGQLLSTWALKSASQARTVQVRNDRAIVTDGPFAETKEQLGGYFLVEARDMEQALEIAAAWPSARIGRIEVRPVEPALPESARY